ncbi:DUF3618 domain-containing protein [Leifsonia kafniensis]|uniref:DUF3618 domain-containing protein n=1 Tax=Leifsonia kafniensis TaxID=475957 RepID=A0ABP7K0N3_9MICO
MTNSDPDQIRADIERTRSELGSDVDALADKVTPSKIAHRQTEKVKNALGSVTERVMGTAADAREAGSDVVGALADAPHKAVEKAKGNPLAVGLIAFGVGWLAASLIPASTKEKEIAESLTDAAQPLLQEVQHAAMDMADDLREPAEEAVAAVKETTTDAAEAVKSEATSAVSDLKDETVDAAQSVQDGGTRS